MSVPEVVAPKPLPAMVGHPYNNSGVAQHMGPSWNSTYVTHHHTHNGEEEEHTRILDWLAPNVTEDKQETVFMAYQKGTYSWFFKSEEFTSWLTEDDSNPTLWCYGDPGVGKTVLSSAIVEHIRDRYANDDSVGIAVAYCDYGNASTNTSQFILGTIARQLALQEGKLHPRVEQEYKKILKRKRMTPSKISLAILQGLIPSLVAGFEKVYIVVDGIDECEKEERSNLFLLLKQLGSAVEGRVQFLATSRPHAIDIKRAFETARHVHIQPRTEDLTEFVKSQLNNAYELLSLARKTPAHGSEMDDEDDLEKIILESTRIKASGMFLMASLQMKRLKQAKTRTDLKKALRSIPPSLDAMYAETLERISNQSGLQPHRGLSILTWMLHAKRPLQTSELIHALAMEEACANIDGPLPLEFDWGNTLMQKDLLDICQGMISIEPKHKKVNFVHTTALEYVERQMSSQFLLVHIKMAKTCMAYLSLEELARGPCASDEELEKRLVKFSFLNYAGNFWGVHLRLVTQYQSATAKDVRHDEDGYGRLQKQARGFLENQGAVISANQVFHMASFKMPNYSQLYPKDVQPLHMAAMFGLSNLVVLLVAAEDGKINLDSKDSSGWTALHRAAENGHDDIVEVLLTRGCSINESATFGGTALHRAAKNGHVSIARLLLAKGAAVDAEDNYGGTPLHRAARGGHVNVATLLLDHGADQARPHNLDTTLKLLVEGGLITAKLISDAFQPLAMWEARDQVAARIEAELAARERLRGGTALHEAAGAGSVELVRLLLERGAEAQAVDNFQSTALHRAAAGGHGAVMVVLMDEAGVTVNTKCHFGMLARRLTSLKSSDDREDFRVGQFVFEMMTGATALHEAARNGHDEAVRTLIVGGADVNSSGTYIDSALCEAAGNGHLGVVHMLLDAGAEVDASSRVSMAMTGGTAMHAAAGQGRDQVVRALLRAGANVDAKRGLEGSQYTPLLLAVRGGHQKTARVLLEGGAEVDWANKTTQRTALSEAAERGHVSMVELLLSHGAHQRAGYESEGEAQSWLNDEHGERGSFTPLFLAVQKGHVDVVRLLLRYGGDASWSDQNHSILDAAISRGSKIDGHQDKARIDEHVRLVEILLEAGADVSTVHWGSTGLHKAAATGQDRVATLLLDHGADVDVLDFQEQTPLYEAANGGHLSMIFILLAAGARMDLGSSPLQGAIRGGYESAAETLIKHGATIDPGTHEETLYLAARRGIKYIVRLMLEMENTSYEYEHKKKALHVAAHGGHGAIIDLLLENGAPIEGKDESSGFTPLLIAVVAGHESLAIDLVQSKRADTTVKDLESGHTLLSWAAEKGMEALVSLILSRADADLYAGDLTAVSRAAKNGHLVIVKQLSASGLKFHNNMQENGFRSIARMAEEGNKEMAMELVRLYSTEDLVGRQFGLNLSITCDDFEYASEHLAALSDWDSNFLNKALKLAIWTNNTRFTHLLLDHGAKMEADGKLLQKVAQNGNQTLLELILDAGECTNIVRSLEISLGEGNFTTARFLLAKMGSSEREDHECGRILLAAAEAECEDIVRSVTEKYSVNRETDYVEKAMLAAAVHGHLGILQFLLKKTGTILDLGNDAHVEILTSGLVYDHLHPTLLAAVSPWPTESPIAGKILAIVCAVGNLQAVKFLLDNGISPKDLPDTAKSLHACCIGGHLAIASLLLNRDTAVDTRDQQWGQTGLSFAVEMANNSIAILLIQKGADVNTRRDDDGNTPLIFSAMKGNGIGARMLLKEGNADPNLANNSGKTPLIFAVKKGSGAVTKALLELGADIEMVDKKGRTALHYAAILGRRSAARLLLEHPKAIELIHHQDRSGKTPLCLARDEGWVRLAELLFEKSAGETEKDVVETETKSVHEDRVADVPGEESKGPVIEADNEDEHGPIATKKQDNAQEKEQFQVESQRDLPKDQVIAQPKERTSDNESVTTTTDDAAENTTPTVLAKQTNQARQSFVHDYMFSLWSFIIVLAVGLYILLVLWSTRAGSWHS